MLRTSSLYCAMAMALSLLTGASALAAENGVWSVSKSSGEVWLATTGAQPASLKQEDTLKPGDTIRTGRNGRVLLVRGEETILIAPNSVIGLLTEKKDGLSTTIQQQAGSILLEVEKRNVKHFEVETPYLAAVVKGTQFSVTVDGASTRVDVRRGQVEVADFKSGQIAQVMPGQAATSFAHGKPGLSLSGSGTFSPIEQGKPRASSIERVPVPKGGLPAPHNVGESKTIHALAPAGSSSSKPATTPAQQHATAESGHAKRGVVRISTALGEVRLNVGKATHGLAHGSAAPGLRSASRDTSAKDTIWGDSKSSTSSAYAYSPATGTAAAAGSTTVAAATPAAAAAAASGSTSDSGNGSNGNNGNGNGNGATGNGKSAGNGNGNGGVGNGNGKGNAKH
jgi:hypothetical protein